MTDRERPTAARQDVYKSRVDIKFAEMLSFGIVDYKILIFYFFFIV